MRPTPHFALRLKSKGVGYACFAGSSMSSAPSNAAIAARAASTLTGRSNSAFTAIECARTTGTRTVVVENVMTPNVSTVSPGTPAGDAVRLMRKQRVGAIPVVEGNRVVGILTRSDVLDAFLDLAEIEGTGQTGG